LARLERGALIDHLPEVLDGLAAWIEGRTQDAERAFNALAEGHAVQRLGFGIELPVVNIEYAWLRRIILSLLLEVPPSSEVQAELIRLNEGLDRAILFAIRRYTERRDYVRDRFIGILGHDLRNPLNVTAMATQNLLSSNALAERERKQVQMIERAAERMARMVNDVLDFTRGHLGGGIPVTPREDDMGGICRAAVEEAKTGNPGRTLVVHTEGDLRGNFDRDRVLQAIGNLVGNAIQHGADPVTVVAREAADQRAVETSVSNRGKPIPAAMIAKLFEPFSHAGDVEKGTLGLGLFIVGQIALAHGATCAVSSSNDETVFTIRWPRTPIAEVPNRT